MNGKIGYWQSIWNAITGKTKPLTEQKPVYKVVKRPIGENVLNNDFWISQYSDMLSRFTDGMPNNYPINNPGDRRYGSNYPFWYSEQQLGLIRAQARLLTTTNPNAIGFLNGLTSYVIGAGFNYRVTPKAESGAKDALVQSCQKIIEEFKRDNDWVLLESEIFMRSRIDGECFVRMFRDELGRVTIRIVEPEMVFQKPDGSFEEWSYGIKTDADDVLKVEAYHVDYYAPRGEDSSDVSATGEDVPADRIVHVKVNVPKSVKRGLSDFSYETMDNFAIAAKLRKNLGEGASVQAAIAAVRQHDTADSDLVDDFVDEMIDYSVVSTPAGRQTDYQKIEPGTFLDIPKGLKYVEPPGASSSKEHLEILQSLLRSAGSRHNAPEWLSSGSMGGASYASSLTAESPFLRSCVRLQSIYKISFEKIFDEVIRAASEAGRIDSDALDKIEVVVTPPPVEARDKIADSTANQVYYNMQIKSAQTIAQEQNLDYEAEQQNFQKQAEDMGGELSLGGDAQTVSDSALNGLQIENLTNIVMNVAAGHIPAGIARAMAKAAFPLMDEGQIAEIFPDSLYNSNPMEKPDAKSGEQALPSADAGGGLPDGEDPSEGPDGEAIPSDR